MSRVSAHTKLLKFAAIVAVVLALAGLVLREEITTSMQSPDGQMRAILLDRPHLPAIDRNFRVRIETADGVVRTVFRSPDEAPSGIGSERFLWSKDGKRLLLVGRGFWVRKGVKLQSGEVLYFLYDLPSEQVWCNSDADYNVLQPFGVAELSGYDFGEVLSLSEAENNDQPPDPPPADQPDG